MALNSTLYPNVSRVVAGAAILFANDGIILCDTSIAPVTMTLLEIPAGFWQTTWKLYVLDNNNNAGTHNITISVPVGYTINNASTLVINTNGGGVTITIASNTAFFGQVSPYPSGGGSGTVTGITFNSPLTGGTINVSGNVGIGDAAADGTTKGAAAFTANDFDATGGVISIDYTNGQAASASAKGFLTTTDWTRFDNKTTIQVGLDPLTEIPKAGTISFNSASFKIISPSANVAKVNMFDSGWVDLLGFAWVDAAIRPKCRRYGNAIYFKGTAVVPMEDPTNAANLYQPYDASTFFYEKVANSTTYVGVDAGGCVIDPLEGITFNNGNSVLPTSVFDPSLLDIIDTDYYTGWKPFYRRFFADVVVPPSLYRQEVSVTAVLNASLTTTGTLRAYTILDIEHGISTTPNSGLIGSSTFRMLTPSVVAGDIIPNFIARDAATGESAQVGSIYNYLARFATFSTATGGVLTVTAVPANTYIEIGQTILTATFPANTFILQQLTGVAGQAGTYQITNSAFTYVGASSQLDLSPSLNALMQTGTTPYTSNYVASGTIPFVFPFDMDGSKPTQLGGMLIDLSGLVVFIEPKTS
jgi:hypothetical protein